MILNKFPTDEDFYQTYWNKKPFVVRGAIDPDLFESLIDGDTLAGLSLEEEIKSRLVITAPRGGEWTCEHGPFEEERFQTLGEKNWSLLVQNVEKYHTDTAALLDSFNFSPRWLLDDIMVSYSAVGGSVGPHTDSYHVFLVQGMGRRLWRIGEKPVENEKCIEGIELKVLKDGFQGQEIEVTKGDVIYIPPQFAHEGTTLENAMTFSVGFLGPKMSELFIEYGYYLEQIETDNKRYVGEGLCAQSTSLEIPPSAQDTIRNDLLNTLHAKSFSNWLIEYFSTSKDED
jgi:50S ribosomal protein L16 3-hydroxylase